MDTTDALANPTDAPWPHRRLILLDGKRDWGRRSAAKLIAEREPQRLVWISNDPIPAAITEALYRASVEAPSRRLRKLSTEKNAGKDIGPGSYTSSEGGKQAHAGQCCDFIDRIPPGKVQRLLGSECDLLVMDLWSGVDADALGAAVGSLRGGGLLLLLTPALADWPHQVDPEAARIAVHPYSAAEVGTHFIRRLARLLRDASLVERSDDAKPGRRADARHSEAAYCSLEEVISGSDQPAPLGTFNGAQPATEDQAEAIAAIWNLAVGRARRPLVLTADRGRGKSAALGIAAGRLIASRGSRIIVSAPRRSAVETLFTHSRAALQAASAQTSALERLLSFLAPDALLATTPAADLLLIDEAAGIPAPLLEQFLMHYPRICFASTVHGYEGSGRGFDIRFRSVLDQRSPGWRALRLHTPIRWRQGDRVEQWLNQALLLDAEPASDAEVATADLTAVRFQLHEAAALAADETLLRQLFGLLLLGHYQTRPNDLRQLLDGPNLRVASLTVEGLVLATALVAREGRLGATLIPAIFEGRRRPRGHLLPQTLSAHAGLHAAPALGYARIVRIAVHPAARRRGLGRRLLGELAMQAHRDGLDLLGASFGVSTELLSFWHRCGLEALHLGTGRNAASGARAAVVLQALTPAGQDLIAQARQRLARDLPTLLSGPLQTVEPEILVSLLQALPGPERLINADDEQQIDAFADAHRTLEAALPALERLVRERLFGTRATEIERTLSRRQRDLLILSLLQRRDTQAVIARLELSGRAELVQALRAAIAVLRSSHPP